MSETTQTNEAKRMPATHVLRTDSETRCGIAINRKGRDSSGAPVFRIVPSAVGFWQAAPSAHDWTLCAACVGTGEV
jgi:hypothetical protein